MGFEFSDPRAGRRGWKDQEADVNQEPKAGATPIFECLDCGHPNDLPDLCAECGSANLVKLIRGQPGGMKPVYRDLTKGEEARLDRILHGERGGVGDAVHVQVKKLTNQARLPTQQPGNGDAGWDLFVSRPAHVTVDGMTDLHTDLAIAIPFGYFGRITGRSSTLRKRGLLVNEGIIDPGYRGELFIAVFNLSQRPVGVGIGERIAQLIIHRIEPVLWQEAGELPDSERGVAGFGSTGA